MVDNDRSELSSEKPVICRIIVEGALDEGWSRRLGSMQVSTSLENVRKPVTTLSGQVRDQAELMGVLNGLYQLHLTIRVGAMHR